MACALIWPLRAQAQDDVPDQELGLLPPEEDIKANRPEPREEPAGREREAERPGSRRSASSGGGTRDRNEARGDQQTQVLSRGVLRVEAGPTDFALLNSGMLGNGRGIVVGRADSRVDVGGVQTGQARPYAGMGLGLSLGVMENLEVGILQLPVILADGYGGRQFGNIEMHGRYGILQGGPVEFAAQLVLQLPSDHAFGVGLGLPLRIRVIEELVIDTGFETEIVTLLPGGPRNAQTLVNLDVPVAINYYIIPEAFVGLRSGLFVLDFEDVYVPLGVQGGYMFGDGLAQVTGWFQWAAIPMGEYRYSGQALDAGSFEFGVGANFFFEVM